MALYQIPHKSGRSVDRMAFVIWNVIGVWEMYPFGSRVALYEYL